jgi:uncharacterized membrane protein YidH (DUF202 family)
MEDWNPNEWQGRSRRNYENSAFGLFVAVGASAVIVVVYLLINLL